MLSMAAVTAASTAIATDLPVRSPLPVFVAPDEPQFMLNQILVKFDSGITRTEAADFCMNRGATMHRVGRDLGYDVVEFPMIHSPDAGRAARDAGDHETCRRMLEEARAHVLDTVAAYESSGLVEWARPNHLFSCLMTPNDPYYTWPASWPNDSAPDQYWMIQVNPEDAWTATTGENTLIVLTDSGLDLDHPDLADNIWTNPGEVPGNGVDDDGNGYVDDMHGYDFAGNWVGDLWGSPSEDSDPDVRAGDPSCGDGDDNNLDGYADAGVGHGTMTSGAAACVINNGTSFAGAAGGAKIAMARCMSPEGTGTEAMIAAAFEYARRAPADVISSSLGGPSAMNSVRTQIQLAISAGIPVFVASGNSGANEQSYPAAYSECCAVGGAKHDDSARTSITTHGNWLDCVAASGDVSGSTWLELFWSVYVASVADANGSGSINPGDPMLAGAAGTSLAAPLVAGLGALVRSVAPAYSATQIYDQIYDHCYDIPPAGFDIETGHGRVDFSASLADWSSSSVATGPSSDSAVRVLPNPSGGEVSLLFAPGRVSEVRSVEVYDLSGRLVRTLPGSGDLLIWDGQDADGMTTPSGVYFFRVHYADGTVSAPRKLVRIR
jgi:subtilisin family serine protease